MSQDPDYLEHNSKDRNGSCIRACDDLQTNAIVGKDNGSSTSTQDLCDIKMPKESKSHEICESVSKCHFQLLN